MTSLDDATFDHFVAQLRQRLVVGAREYGNTSFERPLVEIIDEIEQEALDIVGWGYIAWARLERLRRRIEQLEGGADGIA